MKRQLQFFVLACTLMLLGACASTPGGSDPITATYQGCTAARAAVQATNTAVVNGTLKKADAEKAYTGLAAMQAGCNAALAALQSAPPASSAQGVK
jgi:hypothetical protein